MAVENETVVVFIVIGVVAADFHEFGDESSAGAAFEVHDDVQRISDICLDGAVGQVHATLQHAARESREALPRRSGMHG